MKGYWENLRPFEKRVVVGVGALFFIVLNFLFVLPHFSDLSAVHYRMEEAQRKLAKFQTEIAQTNMYATGLKQMEGEAADVPSEEQDFQFANAINTQVLKSGVRQNQGSTTKTQTNQFFLEKSQSINVQAAEQQLVDFLYQLGAGGSQIRVRDLTLHPDPTGQQLMAGVKLVASYQKKPTARPASSPAATPATPASPRTASSGVRSNNAAVKPQSPTPKKP
jgi:type II secretory pathway component PulM